MSSVEVLRQAALQDRNNEIASVARQHRARLRGLRAVTDILTQNIGLHTLINVHFDTGNSPPAHQEEDTWLKSNELVNGHTFDETSLQPPSLPSHDATTHAPGLELPPTQPTEQAQAAVQADGPATKASVTTSAGQSAVGGPTSALLDTDNQSAMPQTRLQKALQPDGPAVAPENVTSPAPNEEVDLPLATKERLDLEVAHKPAKTVHLPPEHVQEEQFRQRREAAEEERRQSESDKSTRPSHLQTQTELASSPSSTVDAYSAATPMPPQDSPDTSPDAETARVEVLPPIDLRPSPEEQQAKGQHDRLLEAQKEIARTQALGDEATPDEQLKWEVREAAARDAEEKVAREAVNGPEADAEWAMDETEAEQVMEDVQADDVPQNSAVSAGGQDAEPVEETGPPSQQAAVLDDDDNITVTPRLRPPQIDTSRVGSLTLPVETSPAPPRMTTRVSSGAMHRKSVSEILGETPASTMESPNVRREVIASPEAISPRAVKHSQECATGPSTILVQTPRRAAHQSNYERSPNDRCSALEDLSALKGAAEDSDRDYLEPLFRIQAYDSPNSRAKALPALVKDAAKYISTQDQFTTLHERMDYRVLRRIYHLQNANKWSLRQMERCNEPEPPVTHHDRLMAEMKWMRKDFRAERKMKKSVCAWLARRCADWVAANVAQRKAMQVKLKPPRSKDLGAIQEQSPEHDVSGQSASEDGVTPHTPKELDAVPSNLVVPPELSGVVTSLQKAGQLGTALQKLPVAGLNECVRSPQTSSLAPVSKFVEGKVLPKASGPMRKRSRFDYEDEAELLEAGPESKRLRSDNIPPAEVIDVALFHPDNKHIRDRLHANNAFRPPSEFVMPTISFYEFRNGSQWIWEDDQKLRKLAKEYSFNWSLIADEMALPSRYKSSAERRTPWECFERWVDLEQLPAEMRKTMYFKTWFGRLDQSHQAAERRYQARVAALQQHQAQNGQQMPVPMRPRMTPIRVEKRKNTRYLWMVDGMRKSAKKRENNAYKQAEAHRAAAQRKSQTDNTTQQRGPMLTPQEFSKRRQERDLQMQEMQRQHRQKMLEAQQRQIQMVRAAQQQGVPNGVPAQQRPGSSNVQAQHTQMQVNGLPSANINGQLSQQGRPSLPNVTRNGHLAVPQVNVQGIPQAQMRPGGAMAHGTDIQRIPLVNGQRVGQYGNQQYQMPNGSMPSPGSGGMTTQQQLASNQALLAQMQSQANNASQAQSVSQSSNVHQMSASPNMPPPPTPHSQPQQLSSGHVPALFAIKNELRAKNPNISEEQLDKAATQVLSAQSQNRSAMQARQNAMNAAAGIPAQSSGNNMQAYAHNQGAYQNNGQMPSINGVYMNGDGGALQASLNAAGQSPQSQTAYQTMLRQRQMSQMQQMRMAQSPGGSHATLNGSPGMAHASPSMTPVSPSMAYSALAAQVPGMSGGMNQRPSSRSATPQMQRLGSSNSVPGVGMASGMQSPGALPQGSPRNMQASMAR